jgi:hypothetical protein
MAASLAQPRWSRRVWLVVAGAAALLAIAQVVRSRSEALPGLPVVTPQEPINQVDARLRADGWIAKPDRDPFPFERERAHNNLASLSACSGTGMGFCRYDYQRGGQRFAVVTVPGSDGNGIVHNTFELE